MYRRIRRLRTRFYYFSLMEVLNAIELKIHPYEFSQKKLRINLIPGNFIFLPEHKGRN